MRLRGELLHRLGSLGRARAASHPPSATLGRRLSRGPGSQRHRQASSRPQGFTPLVGAPRLLGAQTRSRVLAQTGGSRGPRAPAAGVDRVRQTEIQEVMSRSRRACFHRKPRPGSGASMHTPLPPPRVREATRSRCVSYRAWRSTSLKPRGLGPVLTRPRERTRPACLRRRLGPDAWAKGAAVRGEEQGEAVGSDPTRRAARGSRGFGRPAGVRAGTDRGIRSQGNTHHADGRPAGPGRA